MKPWSGSLDRMAIIVLFMENNEVSLQQVRSSKEIFEKSKYKPKK
jgi:hypothetical protein